jgi:hypothetical protein
MILNDSCYLEYRSKGSKAIDWIQPLTFQVILTSQQWNKLIINKETSNLDFALKTQNILDLVVQSTDIPSDIILESYNSFKPAKYNYYARNNFNYVESIYYIASCASSFSTFITGIAINASQPYANLDNIHYPTIATLALPYNLVSRNQTGGYLTPDKLGVPYYRGKGY